MVDADDLHAAIVTLLDSVAGLTASPVAFDAANLPSHGAGTTAGSAWFIVRPEAEGSPAGGSDGTGGGVVQFVFSVAVLWNTAVNPNAQIQAALAMAQAIRAKLNDEAVSTTDARFTVGDAVLEYPSPQFAILTIPAVAVGYRSTI